MNSLNGVLLFCGYFISSILRKYYTFGLYSKFSLKNKFLTTFSFITND